MKNILSLSSIMLIAAFSSCTKDDDTPPPVTPGQLYEYKIAPAATNAAITTFNSDHYVYLDTRVTSKNKLLVFFPGTSSSPIFYTMILKKAAALGYHTIGLMYPDNNDIYTYSTNSTDNDRYGQCRLETFDGIDHTSGVTINSDNCIKNRLIKLLQYLQVQYPSQNWQQFLSGADISSNKCVVAGHSQGGGHAFFIAKQVSVEKAISFSSVDWNAALNTSANWVVQAGSTSVSKFYSFNHQQDELFNYTIVQAQLTAMGLTGPQVNIDATAIPYSNSHTLNSLATPAVTVLAPHHSVTCLDQYVPKNANGEVTTEYQKVWEYLLGN